MVSVTETFLGVQMGKFLFLELSLFFHFYFLFLCKMDIWMNSLGSWKGTLILSKWWAVIAFEVFVNLEMLEFDDFLKITYENIVCELRPVGSSLKNWI